MMYDNIDIEDIYMSDSSVDLDILLRERRPRAVSDGNFCDVMGGFNQRLRRFQPVLLPPRVQRNGIYGCIPTPYIRRKPR